MKELLFEIGVEELPALAIEPACAFMKTFLIKNLKENKISFEKLAVFGTPRRLVVVIDDLLEKQPDDEEEIMGPNIKIAYDDLGLLSKAGQGFIRTKGISESDIYHKSLGTQEFIAARKKTLGRYTKDLLPSLLIDMMRNIPFQKRMRWDKSGESFARPVRWILCLFDNQLIPLKFADVEAGLQSFGHRFMSPEPFLVFSKEQYLREMKNRYVVLSPKDREAIFIENAKEKLKKINCDFHIDSELMSIVRNLVEYPFVILGQFDEKYLAIPEQILICEMKSHQKTFSVRDQHAELMPYFICSAATNPYNEEIFAKGFARVLRARFEDGAYYFANDKKKTLREHALGLTNLIFERDLGTLKDKSQRIETNALALAEIFGMTASEKELIKKACPILKADLVTGVVGQFPELQGIMGSIYGQLAQEESAVCEIIKTHYYPRFGDDELPKLKVAAVLSIADKLDTLIGIFAIGKRPQGNKDPFALRRACIGIVRMLIHFGLSVHVEALVEIAIVSYGDGFRDKRNTIISEVKDFIIQRSRGLLIEDLSKKNKDCAVNFADSVLFIKNINLLDAFARAHALCLMQHQNKESFDSLCKAFKRASNIVKKAQAGCLEINMENFSSLLKEPIEKELLLVVDETQKLVDRDIDRRDGILALQSTYFDVFSRVTHLIKPKLDAFFDNVMVMVEDVELRSARLALLSKIKGLADQIADFTHI
jgi:glycyl-tRNA synthetase beta chain